MSNSDGDQKVGGAAGSAGEMHRKKNKIKSKREKLAACIKISMLTR